MDDGRLLNWSIILLLVFNFDQSFGQLGNNKILFVCEHGAARSPIASTYFNKISADNGKGYVSFFRGTSPDSSLTKQTASGLQGDGMNIRGLRPIKLSQADISSVSTVVLLDCDLPQGLNTDGKTIIKWNGIPTISKNYDSARNQIVKRVTELLKSIK